MAKLNQANSLKYFRTIKLPRFLKPSAYISLISKIVFIVARFEMLLWGKIAAKKPMAF